ncbi:NUDIX domain-containing protein [Terracoccus luteus]|uniref:8-oxo-dGTP pyrophosphatase MutT (NUDIX family) n=1 Tax=Terracoccus luteus TaxID=53356 RepID=A0A839PT54_9MICO|nr:NUDIX hydrolase [Terracoccus luteus]MBB2986697.1 8-oxo-dGTP pyrophosphatase MutT (NUDIX family) [Terracoccus luteus]MCP2172348.1 8-oxo-dGTP pyrophosphatase MutT (NUDIX family) [Terracoccus luteus]
MTWPVESTREVYANRWITVREDAVVRPDGGRGVYGVVTINQPAVFVVALTDDDEIVLVTVDRHTVGGSVEVPAGGTDGEDPLVAAKRELLEETGLLADSWHPVGTMAALNGICEAPEHVYLATGLRTAAGAALTDGLGGDGQDEEGISEVRRVPVAHVLEMVRDGEITDGETVASLLYALLALGRVG